MARIYVIGPFAFVQHPAARGLWIKTDVCVALVACEYCNAAIGLPCIGKNGLGASTHGVRRKAAKKLSASASKLVITITSSA